MKKLLIGAIVLRILVSILIFHPDIKTFNYQSSFLRRGVFNIYSYLIDNKNTLPLKENFVYFPLTYLTLGAYQAAAVPFLGNGFDAWLANADSVSMVTNPSIFKYLFILKLPYLVLDILTAYLLLHYFDDPKLGKKAFTLWLYNPFTIFIIYAFGNVDIFPVILTLLSLMLAEKNKKIGSAVLLGVAAGFKIYPLLFVPFLAFSEKKAGERLKLFAIPFAVFGLICVPFLSNSFLESTLISGLTTRIFNPGITVGFGESLIVGLALLTGLFFYLWLVDGRANLLHYWIVVLLIIFSFSHFHIAWLLWVAPFIVILSVKKPALSWPLFLLSTISILIPFFYQDRSMSVSLFRVYSTWFDLLPTPFSFVQKFFDPYSIQSILHSAFAGSAVVISFLILKSKEIHSENFLSKK